MKTIITTIICMLFLTACVGKRSEAEKQNETEKQNEIETGDNVFSNVVDGCGITTVRGLDVNGMYIWVDTHTRAQIEAKWGKPVRYWSNSNDIIEYEWEEDLQEAFFYWKPHEPRPAYYFTHKRLNQLRFFNGKFDTFVLVNHYFAIFTAHNGGIRVGDNISRLQTLGIGTPRYWAERGYSSLGWQDADGFLMFFHDDSGIITSIVYFFPS